MSVNQLDDNNLESTPSPNKLHTSKRINHFNTTNCSSTTTSPQVLLTPLSPSYFEEDLFEQPTPNVDQDNDQHFPTTPSPSLYSSNSISISEPVCAAITLDGGDAFLPTDVEKISSTSTPCEDREEGLKEEEEGREEDTYLTDEQLNEKLPYKNFTVFDLGNEYGGIVLSIPTERYDPIVINPQTGALDVLGRGGYGIVITAIDKKTNRKVAIKKCINALNLAPWTILREIQCMKHLQGNPNIIELIDVYIDYNTFDKQSNSDIYIVMEWCECSLFDYLNYFHHYSKVISELEIKDFMCQLLSVCVYMHSADVLHRDIKPENILLTSDLTINHQPQQEDDSDIDYYNYQVDDLKMSDSYKKFLKNRKRFRLIDFGSATKCHDIQSVEHVESIYVVTKHYRPPEVILTSTEQSPAIDMWSIGCVFAELLFLREDPPIRQPLFYVTKTGLDGVRDHLLKIIAVLGKPRSDELMFGSQQGLQYFNSLLQRYNQQKIGLDIIFSNASPDAIDLLGKLLDWNPKRRITPEAALRHPYLTGNSFIDTNNADTEFELTLRLNGRVVSDPKEDTKKWKQQHWKRCLKEMLIEWNTIQQ
ncbi:hypothetical protein ABK040_016184 [Willaertia magna]